MFNLDDKDLIVRDNLEKEDAKDGGKHGDEGHDAAVSSLQLHLARSNIFLENVCRGRVYRVSVRIPCDVSASALGGFPLFLIILFLGNFCVMRRCWKDKPRLPRIMLRGPSEGESLLQGRTRRS